MNDCSCDDYASPIDEGIARKDLESYRAQGPEETTQMLLDMVEANAEQGSSLLDIGGGIGVIDHELLRGPVDRAVLVEASTAYLDVAREEADTADLGDRLTIVEGDFVRRADAIEAADVVTLDKVICCYPDVDELVSTSAARATRLYGLVLPRDRWYVRLGTRLENVLFWLRRDAYRAFAHPHAAIDAQLRAAGLAVRTEAFTVWWRVVLYAREQVSAYH